MDRDAEKKEPTVAQQIAFIMENNQILDRPTKIQILNIVWLEAENPADIFGADDTNGVDVDLDACADKFPDVIRAIYNLVHVRRRALNQPAREKTDGGLHIDLHTTESGPKNEVPFISATGSVAPRAEEIKTSGAADRMPLLSADRTSLTSSPRPAKSLASGAPAERLPKKGY